MCSCRRMDCWWNCTHFIDGRGEETWYTLWCSGAFALPQYLFSKFLFITWHFVSMLLHLFECAFSDVLLLMNCVIFFLGKFKPVIKKTNWNYISNQEAFHLIDSCVLAFRRLVVIILYIIYTLIFMSV